MWLTLYVLDYVFGVETDEDNAISDFTPNLQELLEWLKERSNVLLKDTEMPEDLLAYGVE